MKIKTLPQLVAEIRTIDPVSAVGESFLTALAHAKEIPHTYHSNRLVADADTIAPTLNRLLGFEGRNDLPHIRTIREAAIEIKENVPSWGSAKNESEPPSRMEESPASASGTETILPCRALTSRIWTHIGINSYRSLTSRGSPSGRHGTDDNNIGLPSCRPNNYANTAHGIETVAAMGSHLWWLLMYNKVWSDGNRHPWTGSI